MKKEVIVLFFLILLNCRGILYREEKIAGKLGNASSGTKVATGCIYNYLFLVTAGDAGIEQAKRKAQITKIRSIEIQITSYLGFFLRRHCIILTGE